jgi:BlaI family transcriptional regulator, penicillinase repressor
MKAEPTKLELRVLRAMWQTGERATVRDVIAAWDGAEKPGYTTVLKTLQIMEVKEMVRHERHGRAYRYIPAVPREEFARTKVAELLRGLFGGDRLTFANALVDELDLSTEEIRSLKRILSAKEKEKQDGSR